MSLVTDSPVNSSSSDDFAAFLDAELDSTSDTSPDPGDDDDDNNEDNDDNRDSVLLGYLLKSLNISVQVLSMLRITFHWI